jgi:GT2 family glycosyltransferase
MQKENTPLISIITLNWNNTDLTVSFLETTRQFEYKNYEILVVDQGSKIDPTERINSGNYPNTKVLRIPKNLGFAGGNNWGMQQAKGDFFFIVNNDTEVTPDLLNRLIEPFYEDASIGVVCPKIRFYFNPDVIQYAGFKPIHPLTGRTAAVGCREEDKAQHDVSGYTSGAHGCAMMVKREVIEKAGMFPESFFLYYEEWDWSYRIIKAGYKIFYQAKGLIFHKESMTIGKLSTTKVYYHTRNRILFMRRNTSLPQFIVFISFFTFLTVPKSVMRYLFKKQFHFLKPFFKGAFSGITTSKYSVV